MKHIKPFRSVFDSTRYCGAIIYTAKGWDCHAPDGKRVGTFDDPEPAVAKLRVLARENYRSSIFASTSSTSHLKRYTGFAMAGQST
jgi:hypothetical protein